MTERPRELGDFMGVG